MAKKNPLAEGIVGRELINHFTEYEDKLPIDAECLSIHPHVENNYHQVQYRITFADGSVSDWLVSFADCDSSTIVAAEQFNEVL